MGVGFFSDCSYEHVVLPNSETFYSTINGVVDNLLQINAWDFYKLVLSEKDLVWSIMIQEDQRTIQSVCSTWKQFEEIGLSLVSQINCKQESVKSMSYFSAENLAFDQFLITLFACFSGGGKIVYSKTKSSGRNAVLNRWIRDFPFLSNYFSENKEKVPTVRLVENRWNTLVNENTDLDGLVELILHYGLLHFSILKIDQFKIVCPPHLIAIIHDKIEVAIFKLRQGNVNDWNTDIQVAFLPVIYQENKDRDLPTLDWTCGKDEFPDFPMFPFIKNS